MLTRAFVLVMVAGLAFTAPVLAGGTRGETRPELVGFASEKLARLDSTIEEAIRNGAAPGAALAIGRRGELVRLRGYGRLTYAGDAPAVTDSTLFDLASLTKVVGTTTAIMKLVDQGRLDLDIPIFRYVREWPSQGPNSAITLRHLLTHTSGLPAGADLWLTQGRDGKIARIGRMRPVSEPGVRTVYSDLGLIVAAAVVESVTGERIDDFLQREVFAPLLLRETLFNPSQRMLSNPGTLAPIIVSAFARSLFFAPLSILADWSEAEGTPAPLFAHAPPSGRLFDLTQVAPTEFSESRGAALQGVVHDRNAAGFDGVAGHAGLFSSARDLAIFAQVMLDAAAHDVDSKIARAATVDLFVKRSPGSLRALGWDLAAGRSSAGSYFPATSFGHTGFTGTSIWIDPEHDIFVVLLTNRVFPTARNQKHIALRRAVHDAVELAVADEVVEPRGD